MSGYQYLPLFTFGSFTGMSMWSSFPKQSRHVSFQKPTLVAPLRPDLRQRPEQTRDRRSAERSSESADGLRYGAARGRRIGERVQHDEIVDRAVVPN